MMYTGYYNTTNLTGKDLKEANQKAFNQEEAIMDIFADRNGIKLTPSDVWTIYCREFKEAPLTSIRRAITGLTNKGSLVKTEYMRRGLYGKLEHCWKLNSSTEQLNMFN